MRLGSSAAICAWAAVIYLAASSFWRVRSSLSVRKAVQKDVYILQGDSTVGGAIETASRLGKLLKDEGAPATYYNMTVAVLDTAKPQYLTNLSFVGSPNTTHTHHVDSSPRVWLYALFNVNYDGAELAVHFAR